MTGKLNLTSWEVALITYVTCAIVSLGVAGIIKLIFFAIRWKGEQQVKKGVQ
jgi:hypothetical protein